MAEDSDDLLKIISDNINYLLKKNDVQAIEVANALGVSQSTVSTWTRGEKLPRAGAIQKLANYFGVTKREILVSRKDREIEVMTLLSSIDLEQMIDAAITYKGKELTENDKLFFQSVISNYLNSKE